MQLDRLLTSFENDGYIYCLSIPVRSMGRKLVKLGKIGMKRNDTEQQVLNKLLRRYNTYYGEHYDVIHFERVGNCHAAEKYLFDELTCIKCDREMYYYDVTMLSNAFEEVCKLYPSIQKLLCDSDLETLFELNEYLRNQIKT